MIKIKISKKLQNRKNKIYFSVNKFIYNNYQLIKIIIWINNKNNK